MNKLKWIQISRALAAILVVMYHANESTKELYDTTFLDIISRFGNAGVDMFFVISGFIIYHTSTKYIGNKKLAGVFLLKRVVRLYPIYWIVFTGFFVGMLIMQNWYPTDINMSLKDLPGSLSLWFGHAEINGVSWTLSYEMFFYLLFFLFLIHKRLSIISWLLLIGCLVNLFFRPEEINDGILQYLFNPLNIEFALGVLAAYLVKKKIGHSSLALIGVVLFFACGIFLFEEVSRVYLYGIPSFLFVWGVVTWENNKENTFKIPNWIMQLGNASYSLYLIHLPMLRIYLKLIQKYVSGEGQLLAANIAAVVLLSALAIGFYWLIERPLLTYLNGKIKARMNKIESREN